MKILYLVRHAKSSWKDNSLDDFDRPLNKRGKRDAPFMGEKLKIQGIMPGLVISSPAKRAKKTSKAICEKLGFPKNKIQFLQQIYEASMKELLETIQTQDDQYHSLMIFGHNPEFTALSNHLSNYYIANIPTTGVSCIRFNVSSWKEVNGGVGEQVFFDYPKKYNTQKS